MAITYVGKGSFCYSIDSASISYPESLSIGDMALLFIESANQPVSAPIEADYVDAWTQVPNSPRATGTPGTQKAPLLAIYYGFIDAIPSAGTTTTISDSGDHTAAIMCAFRGVNQNNPLDAIPTYDSGSSSSIIFPTITTATDGAMIVNVVGISDDIVSTNRITSWANSDLESITEGHDETSNLNAGGGIAYAYGIKSTAGSVSGTTATNSATWVRIYMTLALKQSTGEIYNGTVSISQSSTVTASGTKAANGVVVTPTTTSINVSGRISVSYVSTPQFVYSTGNVSAYSPTNCVVGDLLLLFVESENQPISTPTSTVDTSVWTNLCELGTGTAATDTSTLLSVFYKWATSADVTANTTTLISDTGDHTSAMMVGFRGVNVSAPFDTTPVIDIATGTPMSFPALTTVTDGAMIVNAYSLNQDYGLVSAACTSWENASLSSITLGKEGRTSYGGGGGVGVAYGIKLTAGTIDATTTSVGINEAALNHAVVTMALRSVATGNHTVIVVILQASTVAASGKKVADGTASITQASTVTATLKKVAFGTAQIPQASAITETGNNHKATSWTVEVYQASPVVTVIGTAFEVITKTGASLIPVTSTMVSSGQKSATYAVRLSESALVSISNIFTNKMSAVVASAQTNLNTFGNAKKKSLTIISNNNSITTNASKGSRGTVYIPHTTHTDVLWYASFNILFGTDLLRAVKTSQSSLADTKRNIVLLDVSNIYSDSIRVITSSVFINNDSSRNLNTNVNIAEDNERKLNTTIHNNSDTVISIIRYDNFGVDLFRVITSLRLVGADVTRKIIKTSIINSDLSRNTLKSTRSDNDTKLILTHFVRTSCDLFKSTIRAINNTTDTIRRTLVNTVVNFDMLYRIYLIDLLDKINLLGDFIYRVYKVGRTISLEILLFGEFSRNIELKAGGNMAKTDQNIEIYQKEDKLIIFDIKDGNEVKDLTDGSATWVVYNPSSAGNKIIKNVSNGITIAGNKVKVIISANDTKDLSGAYRHELRVRDASGNEEVSATGTITIIKSYT